MDDDTNSLFHRNYASSSVTDEWPLDFYPDASELPHIDDSSTTNLLFLGRFSFELPPSLRANSSKGTMSTSVGSDVDLENQFHLSGFHRIRYNFNHYCDAANQTEESIFTSLEKKEQKEQEKSGPGGGTNPADFPDGGLEAWLVVLGGWCCLFCSFGWINCIGIFQEYYEKDQLAGLSPSTISWIPSLETFMMFFGGPVFGKLFDNYGPRYLLLAGSFAHVFGLMMTSVSTQYYQFVLAQGIVSALGASAIFYSAMSSVGTWFFKNRAAAFGIMTSGSSLGGVLLPIMVTKLVPQIGFGWTMRAASFLFLAMLVLANLTVKSRLTPKPKPLKLKEFVTPLKEPPFALLTVGSFMFFFGLFLPFNFIILQAEMSGMSKDLSGYLVSILNATR
jgi:Major Facilitator Superfamily